MAKNNLKEVENNMAETHDEMLEGVMEFSQDISDAERPDPLPVGEYPCTILSAKKTISKTSGRPYAEVAYQITSDDMPADYVEKWQKEKVTIIGRHFFLEDTPVGRYNAKQFCQAVGAPMSNRLALGDFTGLTCKISVDHQPDLEGNPRENLKGLPKKA